MVDAAKGSYSSMRGLYENASIVSGMVGPVRGRVGV